MINGVLFAASRITRTMPATLYAVDAATGKDLWNSARTITTTVGSGLSGGFGNVYVPGGDGTRLAKHFKGEAPKPLNLNSASSVELESVVLLLRKEAAAWIAYRDKTPCKTLDHLKKVPGVPFKKIDDRRDRLVCF